MTAIAICIQVSFFAIVGPTASTKRNSAKRSGRRMPSERPVSSATRTISLAWSTIRRDAVSGEIADTPAPMPPRSGSDTEPVWAPACLILTAMVRLLENLCTSRRLELHLHLHEVVALLLAGVLQRQHDADIHELGERAVGVRDRLG